MNILLQSRVDLFDRSGGDTMLIQWIQKLIQNSGHSVSISHRLQENLLPYDLVHIFNVTRPNETLFQIRRTKKYQKPIVFSPIYQNFQDWNLRGRVGLSKIIFSLLPSTWMHSGKNLVRALLDARQWKTIPLQIFLGYNSQMEEIFQSIQLLLPQSSNENTDIKKLYRPKAQSIIAPFGVDPSIQYSQPTDFEKFSHVKNFILCVGNYSSIKNQITIAKSLETLDLPIVFIGNTIRYHEKYFQALKKFEKKYSHISVFNHLPRSLVLSAFAGAKIHIIASWFESGPPLVNLEAGILGCNVITTNRGYGRYYLGDLAWYCDPSDLSSIRKAIIDAYNAPRSDRLKNHILENFTWEKTAQKTLEAYQMVLSRQYAAQ